MVSQRKAGIVLQYAQMAISVLITLIYTPVMLRILGQNEFGIYNLASSIIQYLSLLTLGFGASYIRFYSSTIKNEGESGVRKLNGLYLAIFAFMGFIAMICGLILTFNVRWFFNSTYSDANVDTARCLMVFLTFNLTLSFPLSVFNSYITSQEKFVFQKVLNIAKTVFSPLVNIMLLFSGFGSIGMVAASTVITIVVDAINIFYCLRVLRMGFSFRDLPWSKVRTIFTFSVFIAINQIIDQINWQTDKVILGKMINGSAVALYSVAASINTIYVNFSTAASNVFTPTVHRIVNSDDDEKEKNRKLTDLFIRVGRLQFFVLALILSGFIFFGRYFIYRWAGPEYSKAYTVALLLICPVTIPLIQNVGIEIQRAKDKHRFRAIIYLLMALMNVLISVWFVSLWEEIGAAIGTTISLVVANGIIMNVYYYKAVKIDVISFWKSILSIVLRLIIPFSFGLCIMLFYTFHSLFDFVLLGVLYVLVYFFSAYFFAFNKSEKDIFIKIVSFIVPKKRRMKDD